MTEKIPDQKVPIFGPFFGAIGASSAMILCAMGTGYATAKAGTAISAAATVNPTNVMRTLLPIVMGSIISIYGLVASIIIVNAIEASEDGYALYTGFLHFGSGIAVGIAGLAAGYAIGEAGAAGVRTSVYQSEFFVGLILILIFAEVIGLYGLIISLLLTTK